MINVLREIEALRRRVEALERLETQVPFLVLGTPEALTISGGAITISRAYVRVDTESAAATDDLDTISGGVTGQLLVMRSTNSSRTVVVKDGLGNINLAGGADFSLDNSQDMLLLLWRGDTWLEISRSNNA